MENNRTDRNSPAFSKEAFYTDEYGINKPQEGLTKREYFAAMALQGLLANGRAFITDNIIDAVKIADALIEELNKPPQN